MKKSKKLFPWISFTAFIVLVAVYFLVRRMSGREISDLWTVAIVAFGWLGNLAECKLRGKKNVGISEFIITIIGLALLAVIRFCDAG